MVLGFLKRRPKDPPPSTPFGRYLFEAKGLAKRLVLDPSKIPTLAVPQNGGYFVQEVGEVLQLIYVERGVRDLLFEGTSDEMLREVFELLTFEEATAYEALHRNVYQDYRRVLWEFQLDLLAEANPAWAEEKRAEIKKVLLGSPYDDSYDLRRSRELDLIEAGVPAPLAYEQACERYPPPAPKVLTPECVTGMIREEMVRVETAHQGAEKERRENKLQRVHDFLEIYGFPTSREDKEALSLLPIYHDELQRMGVKWEEQNAALGNFEDLLEIDFSVITSGYLRGQAWRRLFHQYVRFSLEVIRVSAKSDSREAAHDPQPSEEASSVANIDGPDESPPREIEE